jgi:hypothetical protein
VVVIERFARELAVLTGSGGRLSGEVRVGGCEMADADELKACDAPLRGELGELALLAVAVCEQLLADVVGAVLAQRAEVGGVAAGFGEAVAAVAEGVRARRKPPVTLVTWRWLEGGQS